MLSGVVVGRRPWAKNRTPSEQAFITGRGAQTHGRLEGLQAEPGYPHPMAVWARGSWGRRARLRSDQGTVCSHAQDYPPGNGRRGVSLSVQGAVRARGPYDQVSPSARSHRSAIGTLPELCESWWWRGVYTRVLHNPASCASRETRQMHRMLMEGQQGFSLGQVFPRSSTFSQDRPPSIQGTARISSTE